METRACKELGINMVMCDIHTYNNDDEILQDLLETNIRQCGDIGGSAKKVGIREGSVGNSHTNNFNGNNPKTEKELASKMGVTQQTLQNYKKITEMIPELEELVDTGISTTNNLEIPMASKCLPLESGFPLAKTGKSKVLMMIRN